MTAQIRKLGIVLMFLFLALFAKLNELQVIKADALANDPRNTRTAVRDFSKPRGPIQTADGAVLAQSVPVDGGFERLRQYPEADLFAHIAGYFSFTYGADGIERTYNDELAGRDLPIRRLGDVLTDRNRTGTVTLTIQKKLQQAAKDALGGRRGAVVALNPTNGDVLALWSFPSFDPNPLSAHNQQDVRSAWDALSADPNSPLIPRSFRSRYFPGSTFKVVTAAAAVERQAELVTKTYPTERELDLPRTDRNLRNFGGGSCGGALPALLQRSCNTGFARLGLDLGAEKLSGEANDFGFNDTPPLDLPRAAQSIFPEPSSFERNEPLLAFASIGQGDVSSTPLQMAMVAAGIANGGKIMQPHLLSEIRDSDGELVKRYEPQVWKQPTSAESAAAVAEMMRAVVDRGTGTRARIPGVAVAGKTGTAQTIGDKAHAWFIGFAPLEAPTVAVAVIVESQDGLGEATGGQVAAPIARAMMAAVLGR